MSSEKKTVLITIVNFVIFGIIQSGTCENFTIQQYLGKWYSVGTINLDQRVSAADSSRLIPCEWRDVTEHEDGRVEEVYTFIFRGRPERCVGNVTLVDSEICIIYADGPHLYTISTYNRDQDLILFDKKNALFSVMISRNIEASTEATESFERIAANLGGYTRHIDNGDCV